MAIIKCKMCGGDLALIEGASTAECEYCGSIQTIPNLDDEKKLIQFERAERLRKQCEFDKAAGIYETIVADFRQEAEAYWGLVLCKYGIEYVDDPGSGKKIPTCHRSSFESIMDDSDFEQAMENADMAARKVYREEAKAIEDIRKGIIAVSSNEEPYDIFICYKETGPNGQRTLDSVLAQDVYDALTDKGYRVFFSRITLEDKLGVEYEPYIFAALNSAKVMLTFGTDYEYFNAVWVKNEWSRFLKLMASDKEKHLIPCYKGIDAYDMPKEFAKLQAQDLGKVGAIQDLLRGIEKILPRQAEPAKETVVVQQASASNPTVDTYLERTFMFLEDGNWDSANEYAEKVLDIEPKNARAYLGKLLAELRVSKVEDLENHKVPLSWNKNYKKVLCFADGQLRSRLEGYQVAIERRRQEAELAQQQREEAKRLEQWSHFLAFREQVQPQQRCLATGMRHTAALQVDGTVLATRYTGYHYPGQCEVSQWKDIVAICAGDYHTVGLKDDGTLVVTAFTGLPENDHGQYLVTGWRDITAVCAGCDHTVGLKKDGTVVAVGDARCGQCNVSGWTNIAAVCAGSAHTVGLTKDGTVVAVGDNESGQCNVSEWTDIIAISAGYYHTVGLKADGTVVATKYEGDPMFDRRQCEVSHWKDIVAISAGGTNTVGLKADGTVTATGWNNDGQLNIGGWKNIVAIHADLLHTVGLMADGTLVTAGNDLCGQCNVNGWKLFRNIDTLAEEQAAALKKREAEKILEQQRLEQEKALAQQRQQRRNVGLCQHCGGQLKGLFSKKCVSCGRPKDC